MQMTSPPASPRGSRVFSDEPDLDTDPSFPVAGSTMVPVPTLDGEARVPKPRLTRAKRSKEITLNDLGYRMSWSQSRVFAGRTLFLQKSRKSNPSDSPSYVNDLPADFSSLPLLQWMPIATRCVAA